MELLYFASQRPNALDVLQIRSRQNQQIDQFPLTARNSHTIHSGDSAIRGRVRIVYLPQPYLPSHLEGTLQPSPVLPLPSGSSSRGLAYSVDPSPVRAVYIAHAIQAAAEVSAPCRSKPSERPWQDLRRVGFHGRCWSSQDEIRCTDLPRTLSYIHRPSSTPACRAFSSIAFRATTKRCVIFVCVIDFLVVSWAHRFTVCFYDTTMKFSRRLCMPMASSFLPPVLSIHLLALTCKHADQSGQCPVLPMACVGEFLGCLVSPLVWQTGTDGPTTTYFPAPQVNIQVYPRPSRVRSHASLSKYTASMLPHSYNGVLCRDSNTENCWMTAVPVAIHASMNLKTHCILNCDWSAESVFRFFPIYPACPNLRYGLRVPTAMMDQGSTDGFIT